MAAATREKPSAETGMQWGCAFRCATAWSSSTFLLYKPLGRSEPALRVALTPYVAQSYHDRGT